MGAKITGAGFGRITIEGVESLKKPEPFTPIFDRIEAGTFMVAAAITNSKITINGVNEQHLMPNIEKLKECGVNCIVEGNRMIVDGTGEKKPVDIKTMPYPGFPTDLQSPVMAVLSTIEGESCIREMVFEDRYKAADQLLKMGARIRVQGNEAVICGVKTLHGAAVQAQELRGGAALILAALGAKGVTVLEGYSFVQRGYEHICQDLKALGAAVKRIQE